MIHLYAVVEGLRELPALPGVEDSRLERLHVDDLELVFSEVADGPSTPTEEVVVRHALVVEELMDRCDAILPSQLTGGFASTQELAQVADSQADRLRSGLRRVHGCVELGLRVLRTDQIAVSGAESGGDYLRTRFEQKKEVERDAFGVHERLSRLARASTSRVGATPDVLLEATYLVPRGDVRRFRAELAELELPQAGLDFVCTGPWPPYSFADGERR